MKKAIKYVGIAIILVIASCTNGQVSGQKGGLVPPKEFQRQLTSEKQAQLVDVRTPEEYAGGHIDGALNLDWRGSEFKNQLATLDKNVPVYVYCLGGGRSAEAASLMRSEGFAKVVELEGGMMKWRADGLKEVATNAKSAGMSMSDFNKLTTSDKKVLVDFYAEWCAPCRKMKPALEEISSELKETLEVVRINVDENSELCKTLKIDALPVLHLYEDGKRTWEHKGYLDKQGMLDAIVK